MDIYTVIIIIALVLPFLFEKLADMLNLSRLDAPLPEEFDGIFDKASYEKSQRYTKTKTKFGMIQSLMMLGVIIIFWQSGGFNVIDIYVRGFELHFLWSGLLYVGILMFLSFIVSLPFRIYSTFVLEERFGFNKTTPKTFVTDILKTFALVLVLGGSILAILLALFEYGGPYAWIYAWGALSCFSLFVTFIAPRFLMPIFLKFTPLEEGELRTAILALAQKLQFPCKEIFVIDGSRRSTKTNAFMSGFGKYKRIALFDTLIEKHTTEELVGVLAHEIGHYKKRHVLLGMFMSILGNGLMLYMLSRFLMIPGFFSAFGVTEVSVYVGLVLFSIMFSFIGFFLSLPSNALSRKFEYDADAYAHNATRDVETLISALKKLSRDNLSNLNPHPLFVLLNYSHPPIVERIGAIRKLGNSG
jgi:STE24 endopeptidase